MKVLITVCCFMSCFAAEYKVTTLGTESIPGSWEVEGVMDGGKVYGVYYRENSDGEEESKLFVASEKEGLILADYVNEKGTYYIWGISCASGAGEIVGRGGPTGIFIWSQSLGFRPLKIKNGAVLSINDLGAMVGHYGDDRPFLLENGVFSDLGVGSEFAKNFEELGYHVTHIALGCINNRGEMVGGFCYGKYHEKQKKYITIGSKPFFWNGKVNVIPLELNERCYGERLNNQGVVSLTVTNDFSGSTKSVLWSLEKGFCELKDFVGGCLNDSSIVLGYEIEKSPWLIETSPVIWRDGIMTKMTSLLNVASLEAMAPPYSNTYSIESLQVVSCGNRGINNQNQIAGKCVIWGEAHPCLIEPIKA